MAQDKGPVVVSLICQGREHIEEIEISRAEWDSMTPGRRLEVVEEAALEHLQDQGGYGWDIADPADAAMVGDETPDPLRELAEWLVSLGEVAPGPAEYPPTLEEAITRAREALGRKEG